MEKEKELFLKNVKFNYENYKKFIAKFADDYLDGKISNGYDSKKIDVYEYIVTQKAHKTGNISTDKFDEYCAQLYCIWYYNICKKDLTQFDSKTAEAIKLIRTQDRFKPENMWKQGFYEFFLYGYNKEFSNIHDLMPAYFQNGQLFSLDKNKNIKANGFMHVYINGREKQSVDLRLYLNLKSENLMDFAMAFNEKVFDQDLKAYYKFEPNDFRNDNFLIYTNYKNAQKFVDLIEEIKTENPKLLEGAENINPFMGVVNGYIGFGEEPLYKHSSFNSERECVYQMCESELFKTVLDILKENNEVVYAGEKMNAEECIMSIVRNNMINEFKQDLHYLEENGTIKGLQNPYDLQKYKSDYILGTQEMIQKLSNGEFNDEIETNICNYLLDKRYFGSRWHMKFPTRNNALALADKGQEFYQIYKTYDTVQIAREFLDLFPNEKNNFMNNILDPLTQNKYFSNNHVSAVYPCLNIESEREIMLNKQQQIFQQNK